MAAERALHAHLAERVELVDEDDARRLGFGLLEEIADARGADADEHLDELRAAQAEERHVRFAGDGTREQRLAGPRRADEQHALRNPAAEVRVFFRVLEELDDLLELVLGLVDARDVGEPHLHFIVGIDLRAASREGHHASFGAGHPPEEEAPDADQEQQRDDPAEHVRQPAIDDFAGVLHAFRVELLGELRILDAGRRELAALLAVRSCVLFQRAANLLVADGRLDNLPALEE